MTYQCPYCPKTSGRQQGLSAHVRSAHPTKWNAYLKAKVAAKRELNGQVPTTVEPTTTAAPAPSPTLEQHMNPKWHLLEAQKGVEQRIKDVRLEIARLTALQEELEQLQLRSTALQSAVETFDNKKKASSQTTSNTATTQQTSAAASGAH